MIKLLRKLATAMLPALLCFMALELEIVIIAKEVVVPLASLAGSFQLTMQNPNPLPDKGWHCTP